MQPPSIDKTLSTKNIRLENETLIVNGSHVAKQTMEIFIRDVGSFVDATKFARVRSVTQRSRLGKSENRVEERLDRGGCYEFFPFPSTCILSWY